MHTNVDGSPSSVGGLGNYHKRSEELVKPFWMMIHSMSILSVHHSSKRKGYLLQTGS